MPAEFFQCCWEGVCQGRTVRWYWGCIKPQTAGGNKNTGVVYIVAVAIGLGGVSFLTPNLAFGLTLHGWGKTNWLCGRLLSAGRNSPLPHPPSQLICTKDWSLLFLSKVKCFGCRSSCVRRKTSLVAHIIAGASQRKVHYCVLCLWGTKRASLGRVTAQVFIRQKEGLMQSQVTFIAMEASWHSSSWVWAQSPHWDLFIPELSRFLGSAVIAGRRSHGEGGFSWTHAV